MSLYKISTRGVLARSLYKISIRGLGKTLEGISAQALYKSSFGKTAPQRERCDRLKVTRGLREPSQNSHRATARAIWQAQSDEGVPRAISQELFCMEIYGENAGRVTRGQRLVRACAVEMHMDMSQEPFCAEIYRENAGRFGYHLDWTPGLSCYRKNPSVWPHSLGNDINTIKFV